jgi:hypothetical protein
MKPWWLLDRNGWLVVADDLDPHGSAAQLQADARGDHHQKQAAGDRHQ